MLADANAAREPRELFSMSPARADLSALPNLEGGERSGSLDLIFTVALSLANPMHYGQHTPSAEEWLVFG